MTDRTLLYCVGATKAGTSWLYASLHDHPDCNLRAVKEVHYWDTFAPEARAKQGAALLAQAEHLGQRRAEAKADGRAWQVANLDRRLDDLVGLAELISSDRGDDAAYIGWLGQGDTTGRLIADMTPNYSLLPDADFTRMLAANPLVKVVYLIRDPLARLWSHIRMQATRQRQDHEEFEKKANGILWRILNKGQETHLTERGDYVTAISKLRRVIPEGQLMIEFAERLFTPEGWARLCGFLGLTVTDLNADRKVHEGAKAAMRGDLVPLAVRSLKDQYDWVARNVAPLPVEWQTNLARASA